MMVSMGKPGGGVLSWTTGLEPHIHTPGSLWSPDQFRLWHRCPVGPFQGIHMLLRAAEWPLWGIMGLVLHPMGTNTNLSDWLILKGSHSQTRGEPCPMLRGTGAACYQGPEVSSCGAIHSSSVLGKQLDAQFCSVQSFSHVQLFATLWTVPCQAFLSIISSWSFLKLMSMELVMPSNHLILCCPLLLLPSIFPSIRVFSNESVLHIRWPKYWSFNFSISLSVNIQD